jgi:hypothetical protein
MNRISDMIFCARPRILEEKARRLEGKMGCGASKEGDALQTVDDSVHVMLKHDKKIAQSKGEAPKGYVPRAPHPLLQQQQEGQANGNAADGEARKPIVASEE